MTSPDGLSFPRLAARTRHFTFGQPRNVSISADGAWVAFLRSAGGTDPVHALWVFDVATGTERLVADPAVLLGAEEENLPPAERALRERKREASGGIVAYATDDAGRTAAFTLGGRLFTADLVAGSVAEVEVAGPVLDPRPAPDGEAVAYVSDGALHVGDTVLAADDGVTYGLAEFVAAEEMSRFRGYWWSPDGAHVLTTLVDESPVPTWYIADPADPAKPSTAVRYPHAGAANAIVRLQVRSLDGTAPVELEWDRDAFPYLVTAGWDDSGCALWTVMDRAQRRVRILGADPAGGEAKPHAELAAEPWLEVLPGTPKLLGDGRLVFASDDGDARRLTVDGVAVTPPELYVRGYLGESDGDLLVEGTIDDPAENHVYRVSAAGCERLTDEPGWHGAVVKGGTTVEIHRSLTTDGAVFTVRRGTTAHTLASYAATPPLAPSPVLTRVTERRLPAGVVYPTGHVRGEKLPVLMDPYGGPHHQEITAVRGRWLEPQWWADAGFAVVVVDGRGTPGIAPSFEHAIHLDVAGPVLTDQVDALHALAADHPDLDLDRVAIRGWSFGGYLAALAVLRRPDVFHTAIAGAPVTDWALYDTFYTERYLGLPVDQPGAYAESGLLADAGKLTRPLMLIHGLADDNVVSAHTLKFSSALLAAGRPHEVLPLSGVTHMAAGDVVAENLLLLQRDFLRRTLPRA